MGAGPQETIDLMFCGAAGSEVGKQRVSYEELQRVIEKARHRLPRI